MVNNNGLAERQNKVKLAADVGSSIANKYEEAPIFSIEAQGENLQYQWQYKHKKTKQWVVIPNGITSSLRLTQIPPELDATVFRCKIYNEAGTIYSDEVVLHVNQPKTPPQITLQPSSITVDPTSNADYLDSVYAQIVVGLGGGDNPSPDRPVGPDSPEGEEGMYITNNMQNSDYYAIPNASTVKTFVASQIASNETTRKVTFKNSAPLVPVNDVITWPINHGLNDNSVFINLIENVNNTMNPFVCGITYVDANNIILTINSDITLAIGQITAIISK